MSAALKKAVRRVVVLNSLRKSKLKESLRAHAHRCWQILVPASHVALAAHRRAKQLDAEREAMLALAERKGIILDDSRFETVPVWERGDIALYSRDNLAKRRLARADERLVAVVEPFWSLATARTPGKLLEQQYRSLNARIYKLLVTPYIEAEAERSATLDWISDSHGKDHLDFFDFLDSMSELADNWTESVDVDDYARFLLFIFRHITVDDGAAFQELRRVRHTVLDEAEVARVEAQREVDKVRAQAVLEEHHAKTSAVADEEADRAAGDDEDVDATVVQDRAMQHQEERRAAAAAGVSKEAIARESMRIAAERTASVAADGGAGVPLETAKSESTPATEQALFVGIYGNSSSMVRRALMQGKADVHDLDLGLGGGPGRAGDNVLHAVARANASAKLARYLVDMGAECVQKNAKQQTPFYLAVRYGHRPLVDLLLRTADVDLNEPDRLGNRALHAACRKGDGDMTRYLVFLGANVNVANDVGNTPLHLAVLAGSAECVRLLQTSDMWDDAMLMAENSRGETAYQLARARGAQAHLVQMVRARVAPVVLSVTGGQADIGGRRVLVIRGLGLVPTELVTINGRRFAYHDIEYAPAERVEAKSAPHVPSSKRIREVDQLTVRLARWPRCTAVSEDGSPASLTVTVCGHESAKLWGPEFFLRLPRLNVARVDVHTHEVELRGANLDATVGRTLVFVDGQAEMETRVIDNKTLRMPARVVDRPHRCTVVVRVGELLSNAIEAVVAIDGGEMAKLAARRRIARKGADGQAAAGGDAMDEGERARAIAAAATRAMAGDGFGEIASLVGQEALTEEQRMEEHVLDGVVDAIVAGRHGERAYEPEPYRVPPTLPGRVYHKQDGRSAGGGFGLTETGWSKRRARDASRGWRPAADDGRTLADRVRPPTEREARTREIINSFHPVHGLSAPLATFRDRTAGMHPIRLLPDRTEAAVGGGFGRRRRKSSARPPARLEPVAVRTARGRRVVAHAQRLAQTTM